MRSGEGATFERQRFSYLMKADMKIVPKIDVVVYYPLFPLASARDNTKLFALFKLIFRLQILLRT